MNLLIGIPKILLTLYDGKITLASINNEYLQVGEMNLRTLLKELDINIVSVRGTGYQLQFAGSTEAEGEG